MITNTLITALERAENPRAIRTLVGALEMWTGKKTFDLGTFNVDGSDYPSNGFARLVGNSSFSGINVTADRALESSAWLGGMKIIGEDMGRMGMFLYRRNKAGDGVEKAVDDPLFGVLHDLPNPYMNASAFFESLTVQALSAREGFAEIIRDSRGRVMELQPMTQGVVTRRKNKFGIPFFEYQASGVPKRTLEAANVFNLPGFSITGLYGDDIVARMRHVLGLTLATQEYAGRFFSNDAGPGLILTRPAGAGAAWNEPIVQAIKEKWVKEYRGRSNSHRPAILQDGLTASRIDPDLAKLQLNEQRRFQVIEVCRVLRLSPHMLADLDRATFSNITQLYDQHLVLTLGPWVKRWRQSVYRCLLTPEQRAAGYYAEHNVEDFQRGLFADQAKGFAMLLEKGVYSINEVRRWYNMNPVAGGDEHHIQLNMQTVSDAVSGSTDPVVDPAVKELRDLLNKG